MHSVTEVQIIQNTCSPSAQAQVQGSRLLFSLLQDGRLTRAEIVDKYDLFVGSQATDFGEALTRHDEF